MVEDLPEDIQDELSELLGYYSSLEDLCEHADDIIHYPDCDDMTDVAYYFIDECQSLGEIPDRIRSYIDYEAYGRDLDLEGRFVVTNHGLVLTITTEYFLSASEMTLVIFLQQL